VNQHYCSYTVYLVLALLHSHYFATGKLGLLFVMDGACILSLLMEEDALFCLASALPVDILNGRTREWTTEDLDFSSNSLIWSYLADVCSPILLVLLKRRSELRLAASADDPDDFISLQLLLSDGFWQLIRKFDFCLSHAMDRVTIVSIHGNLREQSLATQDIVGWVGLGIT